MRLRFRLPRRSFFARHSVLLASALLMAAACSGVGIYKLVMPVVPLAGLDFPLPSGMRVFFQEDHSQPLVMVTAVVGSGSAKEPPGKEGMAHLIEHLWFRAKHDGGLAVWDRLKLMGGDFNAFTSHDQTTFYTVAPKEELPTLLTMEGYRLTNMLVGITDDVIKVEREVVRNELRQGGETSVDNKVFDTLFEMLYPEGHPYHRGVIGTHESLNSITLADVQEFVAKNYRPDNVTMVINGDFNSADARKLLAGAFPKNVIGVAKAEVPKEPQVRAKGLGLPPPEPVDKKIRHIKGPVRRTTIFLGWSLPASYGDDESLMNSTVEAMTFAVGSLLQPDTFVGDEMIDGLGCFPNGGPVNTTAVCFFESTEGDNPDELADKALTGLWEMWSADSKRERTWILNHGNAWTADSLFASTSSLWRGLEMAQSLHFVGDPDYFARASQQLSRVKEPQMRSFAYRYLNRDRAVVVIVEPEDPDDASQKAELDKGEHSGGVLEDKVQVLEYFAKKTDPEIVGNATAAASERLRELKLDNGLRVLLARQPGSPLARVGIVTRGGRFDSQPVGLSDVVMEENDARDPVQIAGTWRRYGYDDGDVLSVAVPAGNLAAGIDLLARRIETTHVWWNAALHERTLKSTEKRQKADRREPMTLLSLELAAHLFPNHPLGQLEDDVQGLRGLGERDIDAWISRVLAPANATLVVVGDLDLAQMEQLVRERYNGWRADHPGQRMAALPAPPPAPGRQVLLVDRPNKVQASINIMCPIATPTPENALARRAAAAIVQESLWRSIRLRVGASYGVGVWIDPFRNEVATMRMQSHLQADKLGAAFRAVIEELEKVASGNIDRGSLQEAKWDLARGSHSSTMSVEETFATLVDLERSGLPLSSLSQFPQLLETVTPEAIAAVVQPCVGHELLGVVGPAEAVRPELATLGVPVADIARPAPEPAAAAK